jgi:nitrate reductase gamma subunit
MVDKWLEFARGPLFKLSFLFMVLGLMRHLVLTIYSIYRGIKKAGDKNLNYNQLFIDTLNWLIPLKNIKERFFFSLTSVIFHIGFLITTIFLMAHNELWKRGIGFGLPSLNQNVANIFTLITIFTLIILIVYRASSKDSRAISRIQDFFLPVLISIPFITGYLASHIAIDPFSYKTTMLLHIMSGDLIMILIPITKLSHIVLLPTTQFVAEIGWHFTADSGKNVAIALKKENQPI